MPFFHSHTRTHTHAHTFTPKSLLRITSLPTNWRSPGTGNLRQRRKHGEVSRGTKTVVWGQETGSFQHLTSRCIQQARVLLKTKTCEEVCVRAKRAKLTTNPDLRKQPVRLLHMLLPSQTRAYASKRTTGSLCFQTAAVHICALQRHLLLRLTEIKYGIYVFVLAGLQWLPIGLSCMVCYQVNIFPSPCISKGTHFILGFFYRPDFGEGTFQINSFGIISQKLTFTNTHQTHTGKKASWRTVNYRLVDQWRTPR